MSKYQEIVEIAKKYIESNIDYAISLNDLIKTIDYLKNWVNEQENFELDFSFGRYRMTSLITSDKTTKALGYGQLEVFLPIKVIV